MHWAMQRFHEVNPGSADVKVNNDEASNSQSALATRNDHNYEKSLVRFGVAMTHAGS
jgi:hypothetical protein